MKRIRAVQVPWLEAVRQSTPFDIPAGAQVVGVEGDKRAFFVLICEDAP